MKFAIVLGLLALPCAAQEEWRKFPPLPEPRGVAAAFAGESNGALLVAGGTNFPDKMPWEGGKKIWHDKVWALNTPSGGKWHEAGKLPRPLAYGVTVSWRGMVLCIGGSDSERHYKETFALKLADGKVQSAEIDRMFLPVPLAYAAGALADDEVIYVACGSSEPGAKAASNRVFSGALQETFAWRELPPLPAEPRILPVAAVQGKSFYLFGGASLEEKDGKMVRRYLRDAWSYTADAGWKRLADMPKPCAAAPSPAPVTGGEVLIIGGDDGSLVNFTPIERHPGFPDTVLRYNLAANTWTASGKCPAPRATVPCVSWRGAFVFPSGEVRPGVRSPEVWAWKSDKK